MTNARKGVFLFSIKSHFIHLCWHPIYSTTYDKNVFIILLFKGCVYNSPFGLSKQVFKIIILYMS